MLIITVYHIILTALFTAAPMSVKREVARKERMTRTRLLSLTAPLFLMRASLVSGCNVSDSIKSSKIYWVFSCKKLFQGWASISCISTDSKLYS